MNTKILIRHLEERRNAIGRERDKLRGIIGEYNDLAECCERAHDDLQRAIDALSELA